GPEPQCDVASTRDPISEPTPGWEYVDNVRYGQTDKLVQVRFLDGLVTTYLIMASGTGTEVRTGNGVGESLLDRVGLVTVRRHGKTAQFAAVLEPVKADTPAVTSIHNEAVKDGVRLTVRRGGAVDELTLASSGEVTVSAQGKTVLTSKR
ncbi:MAG: hypothetical protein ACP5XB_08510, partial [Isosphaeraceae bacterium]